MNLLLVGIAFVAMGGSLQSQAATMESPKFEAASVKPSNPAERHHIYDLAHIRSGGQFTSTSLPVKPLIELAYGVDDVSGGPAWVNSDLFDVAAKLNGPATITQFQSMLQSLLEERFRLRIRRDTKEMQVFSLVVANGGLKTKEAGESASQGAKIRNGLFTSPAIGMAAFAADLSFFAGHRVIDETGLKAKYDLRLLWTPDENRFALFSAMGIPETSAIAPPPDPLGPSLFTALREQLGLALVSGRKPTELLVIERIERPDAN